MIRAALAIVMATLFTAPAVAGDCYEVGASPVTFCPDGATFDGMEFGTTPHSAQAVLMSADKTSLDRNLSLTYVDAARLPRAELQAALQKVLQAYEHQGFRSIETLIEDRPLLPGADTERLVLVGDYDGVPILLTQTYIAATAGTLHLHTAARGDAELTPALAEWYAAALAAIRNLETAP